MKPCFQAKISNELDPTHYHSLKTNLDLQAFLFLFVPSYYNYFFSKTEGFWRSKDSQFTKPDEFARNMWGGSFGFAQFDELFAWEKNWFIWKFVVIWMIRKNQQTLTMILTYHSVFLASLSAWFKQGSCISTRLPLYIYKDKQNGKTKYLSANTLLKFIQRVAKKASPSSDKHTAELFHFSHRVELAI